MKILSERKPTTFQLVGKAQIEKTDSPVYCGHYTIDGLKDLISELEKHHKPDEMVSIRAVFVKSFGSYALVVTPDEVAENESDIGIALQGCDHGIDGKS